MCVCAKANPKNRKKFVSYVMQSDCLLEFLTVEETLRLNATLKLKHKKPEERMERVEKVIAELGETDDGTIASHLGSDGF